MNWWDGNYEWIANKWYWTTEKLSIGKLCIDEKDIQWQVYTILTNATTGQLIGMFPGVKTNEVITFFATQLDYIWRMSIMEVCCDMSYTMEWTLSVLFPNAKIVSDRFHVMKNILDDIWAIRTRVKTAIKKRINEDQKNHKEELKKRKNNDDKQWRGRPVTILPLKRNNNWETDIDVVTRIVWQIRKRKRNWNQNQNIRWKIAKEIPEMKDLIEWYEYMHKIRDIFDESETREEWKQKISQWIADWLELRQIDEIDNLINTIDNRFETICNYFISRHSNWFAEWLHSRIQRLISMSRWFVNKDYMIYRIIKLCKSGIKFH